jgi:hypothetical protein
MKLDRPKAGDSDSSRAGSEDGPKLGRASASFAMSATVTILFNTALACLKDAYAPLTQFMDGLAGHNWTTQGLADVVMFLGLGLIFSRTDLAERISPNRLISFLAAAVAVAGVGLFVWFAWL